MKGEPNNSLGGYIAKVIKHNRQNKDLTQNQLAQMVGTQQASISRLESGDILPSLVFLKKVSDSLGMEIGITLNSKV